MYQVDAFTSRLFSGDPDPVCFLDQCLTDETMQAIAAENNVAETAFLAADPDNTEAPFSIR
jgi:PhzF family phenazine biosynthesis protein